MRFKFLYFLLHFNFILSISKFTFKQSFNFQGIKYFFLLFQNQNLFIPTITISKNKNKNNDDDNNIFKKINLNELKEIGIKGLIFDKDNTLTLPYKNDIKKEIKEFIQKANITFNGNIAILSNSIGSSDDFEFQEAKYFENITGIPVIRHLKKKPNCISDVLNHFSNNLSTSELCMIGDRVLTDVVFGNYYGMNTILVPPISDKGDNPVARVLRFFERKLLLPSSRLVILSKQKKRAITKSNLKIEDIKLI